MKQIATIFFIVLLASSVFAQLTPRIPSTVRSRSGQFVVRTVPGAGASLASLNTNLNQILLEPTLLTVSCERIKQLLARQLDTTAPWLGKIYLVLYPVRSFEGAITITTERFSDGWQYRVDLPDVIDRARYVRALVQVLLLEMANRNATARSAEIPTWLIEGFTQELLASNELQIILSPPPVSPTGLSFIATQVDAQKENSLKRPHELLSTHPALTFEELSWYADADSNPIYSASAQLFVHQLLKFPDGPASMRTLLSEFSRRLNWQFSFLHAFSAHFSRPLDTEKWWALQVAQFSGRDLIQNWPPGESWEKLDQVLHILVEARNHSDQLPTSKTVSLQTIIRELDMPRQKELIQLKIGELDSVRLRLAREFVDVVNQYRKVLETYLQDRESQAFLLPFRRQAAARQITETALRELDSLDALRRTLKPKTEPVATAASQTMAR